MQRFSYLLVSVFFLTLWTSCASRGPIQNSPAVGSARLQNPLKTSYQITQEFKPRKNRKHKGMDLAGKKGSPIFSIAPGRVVYAGSRFSGYGKMVLLDHGGGLSSLYAHFNKVFVKAGQRLPAGKLLGTMGRTGRATGVHLHFEVMENKVPVNPRKYIAF